MAEKNNKKPAGKPRPKLRGLSLEITIFSPSHNSSATLDGSRNMTVNGWVGLAKDAPAITVWFIYNNLKYLATAGTPDSTVKLPNPNWSATIPTVPSASGGIDITLYARAVLADNGSGGAMFDVTDSVLVHLP